MKGMGYEAIWDFAWCPGKKWQEWKFPSCLITTFFNPHPPQKCIWPKTQEIDTSKYLSFWILLERWKMKKN